MSANARRRFLMTLMIPFTLSACAKPTEPEKSAKQFMEAYYVRIDLKAAKELSSGLAAEKLEQQLGLLQGVLPDPSSDRPKVEYRLVSSTSHDAAEGSYVFEVHSNAQDIGGRKVFVKLRRAGGKWTVSQFLEEFQGIQ